jgi:DNA-binding CsgD family transcriptional regulator
VTIAHLADARRGEPGMGLLLEREPELAAIERLLDDAAAGRGTLAVVEGPAGLGKTTLLDAAVALAGGRGMTVLRARAVPLEREFSYGVVRQLFEPLALQPDDALLEGAARLAGPVLALTAAGDGDAREDVSFASLHGLYWLTANLAGRTPLLLAVDDGHWADAASLRFLTHVGARLEGLRTLVVIALRRGDASPDSELLGELGALAAPEPLRPSPLGVAAAAELVRAAVGPSASERFCRACHEATGGNPLFLRTLAAAAAADGEPDDATAARVATLGAESIGRQVARRIARLPAGSEAFANALAILGPRAPLRHVAALAGLELERAVALADGLRTASILSGDDALDFAHPVVGAAVGNRLPPGECALAHARAAALLAAEDAPPERQALHLLHAPARGDPDAVHALRAAAAFAVERGAPETAAAYLRRAFDEPPPATLRAPVQLELGLALLATRRDPQAPAYVQTAVAILDESGDRREAALHAARALGLGGYFQQAAAMLESVPDPDLRIDAELAATCWHIAGRVPLALTRLARYRDTGVPEGPGRQLLAVMLAHASLFAGDPVSVAAELLDSALLGPELFREASLVVAYAAMDLVLCDRLDDAERLCATVIDAGERRGSPSLVATFAFPRAFARLRRGRLRDAEADARLSYERKLAMDAENGPPWPLAFLLDALTEQGQLAAADAALSPVAPSTQAPPEMLASPFVLEARGRLRVAQGRVADGLADAYEAGRRWERLHCFSADASRWRADAALALAHQGEPEHARTLAHEHLSVAQRIGTPRARGHAARVLGTLTAGGDGVELLREAVTLLQPSPARLELAHAHVELGAALRRASQRTQARDCLRTGLELAHRAGATPLAHRAQQELLAAGGRPRRPVFTGVDALTAAELRVAHLAAEGATNREIAQRLFVTQRTIETHLRHVFQKLDIGSRTELPPKIAAGELT